MAKTSTATEQVKLWRVAQLPGVDLLRATYLRQTFARHSHEGFAVGVIERGALGFFYRGANVVAAQGAINLANPDTPHTGQAAAREGWTYRMFYMHADAVRRAADQAAGHRVAMPFFQSGVLQDAALAALIRQTHISLEEPHHARLEKESLFLMMLVQLIRAHAEEAPAPQPVGNERSPARRAREYMEAHCSEDISIETLASIARMSPFHFIRVFCREIGLPPHRYLLQARVRKAGNLISRGWPIARASLEAGFADQSHFHRSYRRIFGITPGQYRNFVQYHPPSLPDTW